MSIGFCGKPISIKVALQLQFYETSHSIPLCVVDLWDQTDVCHGNLKEKQKVRSNLCAGNCLDVIL